MEKIYTTEELRQIITPIARRHDITKVFLFGSYARGEATVESDIDLRIDGGHFTSLLTWGTLYAEMEEALQKKLDLVMTEALRQDKNNPVTRALIRNMKRDEVVLYDESRPS